MLSLTCLHYLFIAVLTGSSTLIISSRVSSQRHISVQNEAIHHRRCSSSKLHSLSEAAAPKLRANLKNEASTAEVEEVAESKGKTATAAAADPSRERISQYVRDGQMFWILEDQTIVYEDPSKDPVTVSGVFWMCQPTVAPDNNGDGLYDSVVSHMNVWAPPKTATGVIKAGGTGMGSEPVGHYMTNGYTASWVKQSSYYNELFVDFGDFTVWQLNGKEYLAYETSAPGTTGGMVSCK